MSKKIVRGLNLGDVHFGHPKTKHMAEEELPFFLEYTRKHGKDIDFINLLGDFYDRKISLNEESSKLSKEFIDDLLGLCREFNIKLRWIRGTKTHDFNQLDNFKHYQLYTDVDFRIITTVTEEEMFPEVSILWIPEEYMHDQDEYYKEFLDACSDGAKYDMIFGHGTWEHEAFTCQVQESERNIKGSPVFRIKQWEDKVYGPIIFGHIHTHNVYKEKIYYTGSYSRWCYGEEKPKGFLDLTYDVESTEYKVKFIKNIHALDYTTVKLSEYIDADSTVDEKVAKIDELRLSLDNVRVKVDLELVDEKAAIAIMKETFSSDNDVRIDVSDKIKQQNEEEEKNEYDYVTSGEYDTKDVILMYTENEEGVKISKDKLNELLLKPEE